MATSPLYEQIAADVDTGINNSRDWAQAALDSSETFMAALTDSLNDLAPPTVNIDVSTPASATLESALTPAIPTSSVVTRPDRPTDINDAAPDTRAISTFSSTISLVDDVGAPPSFNVTVPGDAPILSDVTLPDSPTIPTYTIPTLSGVTIQPFDGMDVITFDSVRPDGSTIPEPAVSPFPDETPYSSTLLSRLQTLLNTRSNGGTGLDADAEEAIWNRARDREAPTVANLEAEATALFSASGFNSPPGALSARILQLRSDGMVKAMTLSRDIAIKQAELEQENMKQTLLQIESLEAKLIEADNIQKSRTLEMHKYLLTVAVELYNARVKMFNANMEAYKTDAQVYSEKIKGELAKVEAYKAEVQAALGTVEIDKARVELFATQIKSSESLVAVYQGQLQAVRTVVEVERERINAFKATVDAYASQANAYSAEVSGYSARAQVLGHKATALNAQANAYRAEVDGIVAANKGDLDRYLARWTAHSKQWEAYSAEATASYQHASADARLAEVRQQAYTSYNNAVGSYNQVLTAQWNHAAQHELGASNLALQEGKLNSEIYQTHRGQILEAAKVGAQVSAQLAGSAMNVVNYSAGESVSTSFNNSETTTTTISA